MSQSPETAPSTATKSDTVEVRRDDLGKFVLIIDGMLSTIDTIGPPGVDWNAALRLDESFDRIKSALSS
jgi:hypothetical protein